MTETDAHKLATALDAYMRFRAKKEGVGYELTPEFYEQRLLAGCGGFFNVHFADGEVTGDDEFPKLFAQWKRGPLLFN